MVRLDLPQGEFKGLARQVAQMQGHIAPSYSILEEPWACNKKTSTKVPTDGHVLFVWWNFWVDFFRWILVEKVSIPKSQECVSCSGFFLGPKWDAFKAMAAMCWLFWI